MVMMDCICPVDEEYKEQKRINDLIDQQIKKDRNELMMEEKLLLLGAGESGKSTIIKQMRIIHGGSYKEDERRVFKNLIHKNILIAITSLVEAMNQLGISYEDEANEESAEEIREMDCETIKTLSNFTFETIKSLWEDSGIQEAYGKRNMYHLNDSAKYYLDSLERIQKDSYLPTVDDILRVRAATSGIQEYTFYFDDIKIKMVDVGGQKAERRKWINSFDNVTSIMFLASLSEYDMSAEDSFHSNRLDETRGLYKTVTSFKCLENASVILFLNKKDIFEEKIKTSRMVDHFGDYGGPEGDSESGKAFILKKFLEDSPKKKTVYYHYTCATDTNNITLVFNDIKRTVLNKNLKEILS